MRYMMLIYRDPGLYQGISDAEQNAMLQEDTTVTSEMDARGARESGERLQPIHTATTVRVRDGKTQITDGPFAGTLEYLDRYYILKCKNLDEALEYALKIPGSRFGAVEIRPIQETDTPPA